LAWGSRSGKNRATPAGSSSVSQRMNVRPNSAAFSSVNSSMRAIGALLALNPAATPASRRIMPCWPKARSRYGRQEREGERRSRGGHTHQIVELAYGSVASRRGGGRSPRVGLGTTAPPLRGVEPEPTSPALSVRRRTYQGGAARHARIDRI